MTQTTDTKSIQNRFKKKTMATTFINLVLDRQSFLKEADIAIAEALAEIGSKYDVWRQTV